jgi:hypothetical protein
MPTTYCWVYICFLILDFSFFIPIIIGAGISREIIEERKWDGGRKGRKNHNKKTVQCYLCWDERGTPVRRVIVLVLVVGSAGSKANHSVKSKN